MADLTIFCIIVALLAFIAFLLIQQQTERKDMLDRLMSRSFVEYKELTQAPVTYDPVDMNEQAEYWKEIERMKV